MFDFDTLHAASNALLYAGLPAIVLFTVLYGVRSNWRSTNAGRAVFYLGLSITGIAALVAASLSLGSYPGREWVRLGVYGFFCWSSWRLLVALVIVQRKAAETRDRLETLDSPQR